MIRLILIFFFPFHILSQNCDWRLDYLGLPGDIQIKTFESKPESWWQIDFSALNVPDTILIENDVESIKFAAGNWLPESHQGFRIYTYGIGINDTSQQYLNFPADFPFKDYLPGSIRILYQSPYDVCEFDLWVIGNKFDFTKYELCVKRISSGTTQIDTIFSTTCKPYDYSEVIVNGECNKQIIYYKSYDIEEPIIHNPTCADSLDGWLEFKTIPNIYNIGIGKHNFTISNGICKKRINVELIPENICDDYFIPNIFSPNNDGINDIFLLFYKNDIKYQLEIWDRWGELIYIGNGITNNSGWNGGNYLPGIYIFRIICLNKTFKGNLTLIK